MTGRQARYGRDSHGASRTLGNRSAALLALLTLSIAAALAAPAGAADDTGWRRLAPRLVMERMPLRFSYTAPRALYADSLRLLVTARTGTVALAPLVRDGETWRTPELTLKGWGSRRFIIQTPDGATLAETEATVWPGFLSLLPPILAIAMALITRQVLVSLLLGIWVGAVFLAGPNIFTGTLRALDTTIVGAVSDAGHVKVLLFTLFLGGMVGVMSRSGGTLGVVRSLVRRATTPRRGAVSAWLLGLLVFFDDYANTIIIGPTLRPVTDRLKLSREKLAYLVDATAAPVASIALISTWIGTEVGLIGDALQDVGSTRDAYKVFLETIPYRFYPILALVLGFIVASTGRDWGPMAAAERRARTGRLLREGARPLSDFEGRGLQPKQGIAARPWNAFLPILAVVGATLAGLWWTGAPGAGSPSLADLFRHPHPLRLLGDVFGSADSYTALLWASALGGVLALGLAWSQRLLTLSEGIDAWVAGLRS
ncbi:MAG: hypothetical protein GF355_17270, partial [Candidatus Eisenbacteria bacterium]|nr:hypothetical protein [Candidatus Eisenbacteria bacterium]